MMLASVAIGASATTHTTPVKVQDYLYELTCSGLDYTKGQEFLNKYTTLAKVGCSGIRVGNFQGRNFDWNYDDTKEYVVHVPAENGRHASVGVGCVFTTGHFFITEETKKLSDEQIYSNVAYSMLDGVNDAGVVIQSNMTNSDYGATTGSNPQGEDLNCQMVVRYILDNAGSVNEALKLLKERNVIMSAAFDLHWLISDPKRTVVVEYIKNEMRVDSTANIMTNFYVTLPYYQRTGMGIERFNILKTFYNEGNTKEGMIKLLDRVRYRRVKDLSAYDMWLSEFNGTVVENNGVKDTLTVYNMDEDRANQLVEFTKNPTPSNYWERGGGSWQTVHNATYDIANKTVTIIAQEDGVQHDFEIVQKTDGTGVQSVSLGNSTGALGLSVDNAAKAVSVTFAAGKGTATLDVITPAGQTVASKTLAQSGETVSLASLPSGVYIISVKQSGETKTVKATL